MTPLRSGDLRRRITLQRRTTGQDSVGQAATTWQNVATVWASIDPATGREGVIGQALQAEVTHTITIRYRPNVTAAMRAVYQGATYNIECVIDVEQRHVAMTLLCTVGLNEG
jgi:SPP1 family predicted phage head-tail adaptor